jgi:cytochrome c-type biogenesis protein CcmH/NrfG
LALASPLLGLRSTQRSSLLAAAAGGYVAFLIHAAVDWDWELPAVTIAGLLCGGVLTLARSQERILAPATRWKALAVLAALGVFTGITWRGNLAANASTDAAARGEYAKAFSQAQIATHWLPWDSEPWRLLGEAELARGNSPAARDDFRTAIGKDPHDWSFWFKLAGASSGRARREALAQAARLNPISTRIQALP